MTEEDNLTITNNENGYVGKLEQTIIIQIPLRIQLLLLWLALDILCMCALLGSILAKLNKLV